MIDIPDEPERANDVGSLVAPPDCTTVVVTDFVEEWFPFEAMTSAMIPPAMAPPMTGTHRLNLRMVWSDSPGYVAWGRICASHATTAR